MLYDYNSQLSNFQINYDISKTLNRSVFHQKTNNLYLLSNIECSAVSFRMAPKTAKNLAKDRIVRLLQPLKQRTYNTRAHSAFQHSK